MPGKQLSPRYVHLHPTAAASTAQASPTSTAWDIGAPVVLEEIRLIIPNGHAGLTGIRIDYSGQTILPWSYPSQWFIGNQTDWVFDMGRLEVSAPLTVWTYNTDALTHGWELVAKISDLPAPGSQMPIRAAVIL